MSSWPLHSDERAPALERTFRDLRKRNDYSARVARTIEAKRRRRIEQVLKARRTHRTPQGR